MEGVDNALDLLSLEVNRDAALGFGIASLARFEAGFIFGVQPVA